MDNFFYNFAPFFMLVLVGNLYFMVASKKKVNGVKNNEFYKIQFLVHFVSKLLFFG